MSKESDFVDLLNKEMYELKIADLEAKLAESEEKVKHWHDLYNERDKQFQSVRQRYHLLNKLQSNYDKKDKLHLAYMQCLELVEENEKLKQQLAEKEKRCEICGSKMILGELGYYCSNTELHNIYPAPNEAKPDYEEITLLKQDYDAMVEREELLRQQLAEKDKEIEYYKKQAKKLNNEAQKYFEDAYCNDSIYQDKISFCIEQLKKVKETTECILDNALKNSSLNQSYCDRLLDEIDNQIKQLKVKAERS